MQYAYWIYYEIETEKEDKWKIEMKLDLQQAKDFAKDHLAKYPGYAVQITKQRCEKDPVTRQMEYLGDEETIMESTVEDYKNFLGIEAKPARRT